MIHSHPRVVDAMDMALVLTERLVASMGHVR
jgi:hypothetical protein